MTSLINLDRYKPYKQWCGYVLECTKEKAIYTGISNNLPQRLRQHMECNAVAAHFIQVYGPPVKVLELYFCETEEQARSWERITSEQLYGQYLDRPVYYIGRRSIPTLARPIIKNRKHKHTPQGALALSAWLKRGSKQGPA